MKLAKCSGRDKCGDTSCAHIGGESGIHVVTKGCRISGCFEVPGSSCKIEAVAVVPVSVLRDVASKICGGCYGCNTWRDCETIGPLRAAIHEAEEESHGTDT